ncbi:NAD-dependent epimerase/dehydratase family protein [Nostoc sp. CCCryo 231-06]|nr:NAD-dependent epimerase/dehydratase family protein [Nostoc sp. CCCryo 231-06]
MKVLVTGNEGMIGSVVEKVLRAEGCEVIGFDIANGHNILNPDEIRSALVGCDAIIHLAALLGNSQDAPDEIMAVNLLGTWHILSAAAEAKLKRVVFFSSVDVLGIFKCW